MHLNVVHFCAPAHANQRDTVDLIAGRKFITALGDDHIPQDTTAIIGVITTRKPRLSLSIDVAITAPFRAFIVRRIAMNNQTAPFARAVVALIVRTKDNRRICGTRCQNFATPGDE